MDVKETSKKIKEVLARLFQKSKYERIVLDYIDLARSRPKDMRIKLKIAQTYFLAKQIDKAITTYQEIADIYIRDNFILKAVSVLKNILKLNPTLVDVNLKLADLYLQLDMKADAVNQYRIALNLYANSADEEKLLEIAKKLVGTDPQPANIRKLAEIYQNTGKKDEAVAEYKKLAEHFHQEKNYNELLRVYEIILPFEPDNKTMIKDVCILCLRKQEPDNAIRTMERYKMDEDPDFSKLYDKARLMKKLLRNKAAMPARAAS